jgi:hypothetical protein
MTVNKCDVRENTDGTLSLRFEYLCRLAYRNERGDLVQILFAFVIEERDSLGGKIPVETEIRKGRAYSTSGPYPMDQPMMYFAPV